MNFWEDIKRLFTDPADDRVQENQGEGDREAARRFNAAQQDFAETADVPKRAREAATSLDGESSEELTGAEAEGRRHAAEFDPSVVRDPRRGR